MIEFVNKIMTFEFLFFKYRDYPIIIDNVQANRNFNLHTISNAPLRLQFV